jgi:hypothetical protein
LLMRGVRNSFGPMLDQLLAKPDLGTLAPAEMCVVQGLRLWAVLRSSGQCPTTAVADRLGSPRAAAHLHLLLEEMATIWPEPFAVSPLCCRSLSHDEALFGDMLRFGRAGDRVGFERLLAEMIPADERERLFVSAKALSRHVAVG